MADVIKQRLRRFNGTDYDKIYLETSSEVVLRPGGTTIETDLDANLPETQATDDEPAASKSSKLIIGPNSAWVNGVDLMNAASGISREVPITLEASAWSGEEAPYTQRVFVSGMMTGQDGVLGPSQCATDAQEDARTAANLRLTAQDAGSITVVANGEKPMIDIPVTLILLTTMTDEGVLLGSCPQSIQATLLASGWDSTAKTQTVTVTGIVADEMKQKIEPVPARTSSDEYFDCNVRATGQGSNSLTFTCDEIPENDLTVYVLITAIIETTGSVPAGTTIGVHQYATMKSVTTSTSWTDNGDGWYQQVITIPGTTENTQVDLQNDETVIDQMVEDGCSNLFIKNTNGTLYLMAKDAPLSVAATLRVSLKEVY